MMAKPLSLIMKPQKVFAAVNVEAKHPWVDPSSISWSAFSSRKRFVAGTDLTWDEWKKNGWRIRRVLVIADDGR